MGYALVLDTGAGTHFTAVYFKKNQIDHRIYQISKEFCAQQGLVTALLEVGEMWGANSILVNGQLATLKSGLTNHFNQLGYDVDMTVRGQTAHINIRGDKSLLQKMNQQVDLVNGWSSM